MNIGVLGAGTWGMALARLLAVKGHNVVVWSAIESEIDYLSEKRQHPILKDMLIPEKMEFTKNLEKAIEDSSIILMAVPSVFIRSTAEKIKPYYKENMVIVDVAKGMEADTLLSMSEIIKEDKY